MSATPSLAMAALLAAGMLQPAAALDNGVGLTPPLGWSSWCDDGRCGRDYCTENETKAAAEALLANGLAGLGYRWLLLDDCWAAEARTAAGQLAWDPARFPAGIPALAAWLHARGLKLGVYTSAGNATCSNGGRGGVVPGSEGHYQRDADTFAAWAVDYVKVDWCGDVKNMPADGVAVGARDYKNFSEALTHTGAGRAMYFEAVAAVLFLRSSVPQYANAWRAAVDHHDEWSNLMDIIRTVQLLGIPGSPGAWSYMDVLMTGGQGCPDGAPGSHCPGMTDTEYVSEFNLWAIMQSPLIVATDVRNMTGVMNDLLKNQRILALHQDTRTPPGRFIGGDSKCIFGELTCQQWVRVLADGGVWVVLFNAGATSARLGIDFAQRAASLPPGFNASTRVAVSDLLSSATTTAIGQWEATVLSHGVSSVVLTPM
ncbi:Alpha-galactosidase [Diplonema papillatum]|nr:Alpha-galactosidase [Diplonema papillatum]